MEKMGIRRAAVAWIGSGEFRGAVSPGAEGKRARWGGRFGSAETSLRWRAEDAGASKTSALRRRTFGTRRMPRLRRRQGNGETERRRDGETERRRDGETER